MHSFAVVLGKPRRSIPATMLDVLREADPTELPFDADGHVFWCDQRGTTAFGGWQTATEALGIGSHWDARPDRLTAFSGLPWRHGAPWTGADSWAAQLAADLGGGPRSDGLAGIYSIVSLAADGRGSIWSDPLGLDVLYVAETADVLVVSTRAALAARLVTPRGRVPVRDAEGVGWLAHAGFIVGDRTGYEAVRTTPQGCTIELHPVEGPRVRPGDPRPWWTGDRPGPDDLPAAIRSARDHLASSVQALGRATTPTKLADLSGGKDSRLILSLLVSEGLTDEFVFTTYGVESLPDVAIARLVAERFGLEHRTASTPLPPGLAEKLRPPAPVSYDRRLRHHISVTDGMVSSWDLRPPAGPHSPNLSLSGLCGEALRTNYPRTAGISDMDQLTGAVPYGALSLVGLDLLTPEARDHYTRQLAETLTSLSPEGDPQDAVDGFYLSGRLRRWFGTLQGIDRQNRVCPLYSLPALQTAFAIGSEQRRAESLVFEVMRASCEELAQLPFVPRGWPEAALASTAEPDRFRQEPPPPAPPSTPQTVNQEHQSRALSEQVAAMRTMLDGAAGSPVLEVIDQRAVLTALDRFPDLRPQDRRAVHGAVSAVMWVAGADEAISAA